MAAQPAAEAAAAAAAAAVAGSTYFLRLEAQAAPGEAAAEVAEFLAQPTQQKIIAGVKVEEKLRTYWQEVAEDIKKQHPTFAEWQNPAVEQSVARAVVRGLSVEKQKAYNARPGAWDHEEDEVRASWMALRKAAQDRVRDVWRKLKEYAFGIKSKPRVNIQAGEEGAAGKKVRRLQGCSRDAQLAALLAAAPTTAHPGSQHSARSTLRHRRSPARRSPVQRVRQLRLRTATSPPRTTTTCAAARAPAARTRSTPSSAATRTS